MLVARRLLLLASRRLRARGLDLTRARSVMAGFRCASVDCKTSVSLLLGRSPF